MTMQVIFMFILAFMVYGFHQANRELATKYYKLKKANRELEKAYELKKKAIDELKKAYELKKKAIDEFKKDICKLIAKHEEEIRQSRLSAFWS